MGWQIAQKDGKYRIWSTISDAWVSDWIRREEVLRLHHQYEVLELKQQMIKEYHTFPALWTDRVTGKRLPLSQDQSKAYSEWMDELASKHDEEYGHFINETYDKIMKELEKTE